MFAGDASKAVMVASNFNERSKESGGGGLFTQQLANLRSRSKMT
jgi:hypothetical protein